MNEATAWRNGSRGSNVQMQTGLDGMTETVPQQVVTEIQVELCGRLADIAGRIVTVPLAADEIIAADLRALVGVEYPALSAELESPRTKICVNEEIVEPSHMIRSGDEVAFFPPVSGG